MAHDSVGGDVDEDKFLQETLRSGDRAGEEYGVTRHQMAMRSDSKYVWLRESSNRGRMVVPARRSEMSYLPYREWQRSLTHSKVF